MSRVDAHQIMATALRELADAKRAETAWFRERDRSVDLGDDAEWDKLRARLNAASDRLLEIALGLFPPTTPRKRTR